MTDFDLLDDLDRRLDPLVPSAPLPADLLGRGAALRRRRTVLRSSVVVAAVTALVAGVALAPRSTSTVVTPAVVTSATAPVPPASDVRTVGYRDLALDVPASWTTGDAACVILNQGEPEPLYLQGLPAMDSCADAPTLQVFPLDTVTGRSTDDLTTQETTINGLAARRGSSCSPTAACIFPFGISVVVPELGVGLVVAGDRDQRALLEQVVASIRAVPTGSVIVPAVAGTSRGKAGILLEQAGLDPRSSPDLDPAGTIGSTEPGPYAVVPDGSAVLLRP